MRRLAVVGIVLTLTIIGALGSPPAAPRGGAVETSERAASQIFDQL